MTDILMIEYESTVGKNWIHVCRFQFRKVQRATSFEVHWRSDIINPFIIRLRDWLGLELLNYSSEDTSLMLISNLKAKSLIWLVEGPPRYYSLWLCFKFENFSGMIYPKLEKRLLIWIFIRFSSCFLNVTNNKTFLICR